MQRRPLKLSAIKIVSRTASEGVVEVNGERLTYQPLHAEAYAELLEHVPSHIADAREFLLGETAPKWDEAGNQIFRCGWPGESAREIVGGQALLSYLRKWWPLRDHGGDDGTVEAGENERTQSVPRVIPFTPTTVEVRERLRATDPAWTPGRIG